MMTIGEFSVRAISGTFMASLRSIGTAVAMASVGYYLHRTNSIGAEGKRALAVLSQQVTIPLFLLTKILYCKQDRSEDPCPNVTQSFGDVWMLLFWPIYVVGIGFLVGLGVAKVTNTPRYHVSTVLAACAFGNASALPITLLNVIHSSFPSTSDFGRIDPTLFLSVFMLLYPALLWGFGGWLLDDDCKTTTLATTTSVNDDGTQNIELSHVTDSHLRSDTLPRQRSNSTDDDWNKLENGMTDEDRRYIESRTLLDGTENREVSRVELGEFNNIGDKGGNTQSESLKASASLLCQCRNVLKSCLQPPVIGSVAGIVSVSFPRLRALFVDLDNRDNGAPFQFLFDGLYAIGQSAVPINMIILGCNLSSSVSICKSRRVLSKACDGFLSIQTMVGVVIGKMIVIPFVGILSAWMLKTYVWDIPEDIEGSFYLVLMIVFLTPTANNVMVMVELSGSGAKEGMANVIALQYLVAPIILSCTMTIAIGVASGWTA